MSWQSFKLTNILLWCCIFVVQAQQITKLQDQIENAWQQRDSKKLEQLYMQLGEMFHQKNNKKQALRAWLSILEFKKTWPSYLCLAKHLQQKKLHLSALQVLNIASKLSLTAEEYLQGVKQSLTWRQYALAQQFVDKILQRHWSNEKQILHKLVPLLGKIYTKKIAHLQKQGNVQALKLLQKKIALLKSAKSLLELGEKDIKIVLHWDTATDIDLWITNPRLQRCFYRTQISKNGEKLHGDDTDGFGPEIFTALKAQRGRYKVQVQYFKGEGRTKASVDVILNAGSAQQKSKKYTVILEKKNDLKDVVDIYIPQDL